jgi:hypothetical protein
MGNPIKFLSLLAIATIFVLSACKKDETTKSPTEYLTAGNWKVTGMTINPGIEVEGIVITDIYTFGVQDCTKDDLIKFNADGSVTEDEGATKCSSDDPQTTTDGTWTLSADAKTLTITYPDDEPAPATIVSLNESKLVVTSVLIADFGYGETNYTATITMTLQ